MAVAVPPHLYNYETQYFWTTIMDNFAAPPHHCRGCGGHQQERFGILFKYLFDKNNSIHINIILDLSKKKKYISFWAVVIRLLQVMCAVSDENI
jgi:hypothetical protein